MGDNFWIIYDGTFQKAGQPLVSEQSRGLMYGDGCFDTMRSYSGKLLAVDKHLNRLKESVHFLGMEYPVLLEPASFCKLLYQLLEKNKLLNKDAVIRIQVWREGNRGYRISPHCTIHFTITAMEYSANEPVAPVRLATAEIKRIPDRALPSRFKLSNGINYITAAAQAQAKGADDALMLTMDGYISETTIANIFWVKGNTVHTPSKACDLLPGITRELLLVILRNSLSYNIQEGSYLINDLMGAETAWVCNSVKELVPVDRLDSQSFNTKHTVFETVKREFTLYRDQQLFSLI